MRQGGSTILEGVADGSSQDVWIERDVGEEPVEIVKIFHATVGECEADDGFQLFGDDGFDGIGHERHGWEIENAWPLTRLWGGGDGIPVADIDLEVDFHRSQQSGDFDAIAAVGAFGSNGGDCAGEPFERICLGWREGADLIHHLSQVFWG